MRHQNERLLSLAEDSILGSNQAEDKLVQISITHDAEQQALFSLLVQLCG